MTTVPLPDDATRTAVPPGLAPGGRFAEWVPRPIGFAACDLDGTWLAPDERPHPSVLAATVAALDAGVRFGFATGRLPAGMPVQALAARSGFGPHIAHNGAQVFGGADAPRTDAVWPLQSAHVDALVRLCVELGVYGEFYAGERMLVTAFDERAEPSWRLITGRPDGTMLDTREGVVVTKATLVPFDPIDIDTVLGRIREWGLAAEISTAPIFPDALIVNVTASGVAKGPALRHVLDTLGIDAAATLVIGDGLNDLSMFDLAGTSVAMAAAPAAVQAAAHLIAPHDTGVAVTLAALIR